MKAPIILMSAVILSGCASTGDFTNTEVVVQRDYVVRTAPDALKTLPPLPPVLANPRSATNNQIAQWINNTEEYVANLEAMLRTLVDFYEKPVTTSEIGTMRAVTPVNPPPARLLTPRPGTFGAAIPSVTGADQMRSK